MFNDGPWDIAVSDFQCLADRFFHLSSKKPLRLTAYEFQRTRGNEQQGQITGNFHTDML